ncbi:MAG: histidine--tRNA ligase [Cyclobacteriaceae bacterium]|nr:histidine--tRNA ligase [Cyclobacteriaceae bacterium]
MSNQKPSLPKGTRDFAPKVVHKRNYLIKVIRNVFEKFGFQPLETPTMENLSVLTGKYGDEGDQLIFKVLNSGDYLSKANSNLAEITSHQLTPQIADKGLRYDLTVPFARFVVMNRNEITFPFRRYQIQPVWRADRPQKGRYREFMQCDADVVGTRSLLCEAEIIMMLNEIMSALGIEGYEIVVNSRKILTGMATYLGHPGEESALCVAIDKLDKIGTDGVFKELKEIGYKKLELNKLEPIIELTGSNKNKLAKLREIFGTNAPAQAGLVELEAMFSFVENMKGILETVTFDPSLARGLSYYTGIIFEVKMKDGSIGSISGGGRYDNLTGVFGLPDVSGVGISLGIDRVYDVMETRNLFPEDITSTTKVLITNFGKNEEAYALEQLNILRSNGVAAELYPDAAKLKKQMSYANNLNIPFVILIGSDEVANKNLTLKNMNTGEQSTLSISEVVKKLAQNK